MTTQLTATLVHANPSDDEELASVYFEYERHKYITLSYHSLEDNAIYLEKDNQITGLNSNDVEYELHRNHLSLMLHKEIAKKLGTENSILIKFQINDTDHARLRESLQRIFSAKFH